VRPVALTEKHAVKPVAPTELLVGRLAVQLGMHFGILVNSHFVGLEALELWSCLDLDLIPAPGSSMSRMLQLSPNGWTSLLDAVVRPCDSQEEIQIN
jgi:hypothetical protein